MINITEKIELGHLFAELKDGSIKRILYYDCLNGQVATIDEPNVWRNYVKILIK